MKVHQELREETPKCVGAWWKAATGSTEHLWAQAPHGFCVGTVTPLKIRHRARNSFLSKSFNQISGGVFPKESPVWKITHFLKFLCARCFAKGRGIKSLGKKTLLYALDGGIRGSQIINK